MSETNNTRSQILIPTVLCIGLAAGLLIGATYGGSHTVVGKKSAGIQKIQEVLTYIKSDYVDDVKTDGLVDDAITHMLAKLDPHSAYITAQDRKEANESLQGNYEGIGIEFGIFQDTLVVVTVLAGGPSAGVGLLAGDKIVKVGDTRIAGTKITNTSVTHYLKGPKGTEVKIEVIRKGEKKPLLFSIVRDTIPRYSIDAYYMIDSDIGYIKLEQFAATSFDEFQAALKTLKAKGMKKLILDLQGNGGGLMGQAIDLADEFLPAGEKIVFTKGKDRRFNSDAMSTDKGEFEKGDLIVLVNEGSASASEILAGALQDNDRALIVGRRSFGKGLVQAPFDLTDGSELRLVISRYYTPSGRSIQKPYGKDVDYYKDITQRYKRGEFFHVDSVKFNDSLKYKTLNGRTVYGGGGIMPDYFVPLDTALNSHYLNELYYSNSIHEYTFDYVEKHKPELKKMDYNDFYKSFDVSNAMLDDLVAIGKSNKVKPDYKDLAKNKEIFKIHVKASIARLIWQSNGYYPIINQTNEVLQQAVKMFDKIPEVSRRHF